MKLIRLLLVASLGTCVSAWATSVENMLRPGFGAIVHFESVPGATEKFGLRGETEAGARIFAHNGLPPPKKLGFGGGHLTYVGASVPKWVQVTWREPIFRTRTSSITGKTIETLDFGKIIGDHTVQVASRIPPATLRYASGGKKRAIYLSFRILDDRVLFSWAVREAVFDPDNGGKGFVYSLYGGDLSCDELGGRIQTASCTSGYLKDAPWYSPRWKFI